MPGAGDSMAGRELPGVYHAIVTQNDDVEGSVSETLYRTAFHEHGYGWPTIGWMEDIQNFSPEDCVAFYKTYYAPNNAVLVVVGDFEIADTLRLVQDGFGALAPSTLPVEDVKPEPPQIEERRLTVHKPTPTQKVASASAAVAETTTRRTLPPRWPAASSRRRNRPVASITISTPCADQSIAPGSGARASGTVRPSTASA